MAKTRTLRFLGCHFPENKRIPSASYVIRAVTARQQTYQQVIATERSDEGHTAGGVLLFPRYTPHWQRATRQLPQTSQDAKGKGEAQPDRGIRERVMPAG